MWSPSGKLNCWESQTKARWSTGQLILLRLAGRQINWNNPKLNVKVGITIHPICVKPAVHTDSLSVMYISAYMLNSHVKNYYTCDTNRVPNNVSVHHRNKGGTIAHCHAQRLQMDYSSDLFDRRQRSAPTDFVQLCCSSASKFTHWHTNTLTICKRVCIVWK